MSCSASKSASHSAPFSTQISSTLSSPQDVKVQSIQNRVIGSNQGEACSISDKEVMQVQSPRSNSLPPVPNNSPAASPKSSDQAKSIETHR